ncbi:MAG TPA: regulatory iron-sulfur-containing complex subunit RicT [Paludibacter sp.]|nr:regulatory iron-sulfur-containing complex subunit RicT [Paludibacter sp.]
MDYTLNNGGCNLKKSGCNCKSKQKLGTFDWLSDLPETQQDTDYVEVQFKNTRKGYFLNSIKLPLAKGDIIAVEASPGHDIGEVTLTGRLVLLQMKKNNYNPERAETKRVYRKAKETDIEKYNEAKAKEQETMIKARQIAESLKLNMKIGDVEFQGDGNKAIFYYIADERVDFRQLIKVFAETFRIRVEMKQIGARQEAGRIGGIGPCGRELCCSGWMTSFNSVSTNAARVQDISLNPQKLAGQCAKLKCCMNYELDAYVDASKDFPSKEIHLETLDNTYYHFKTDVFKGLISYSTAQNFGANVVTISAQRAKEVISQNRKGIKPDTLDVKIDENANAKKTEYDNAVGQDSLTRFDSQKKHTGGKSNQQKRNNNSKGQAEGKGNGQRPPLVVKKINLDNSKNEA